MAESVRASGEASGLPEMPEWWEDTARRHAHRALAYPVDLLSGTPRPPYSCTCTACSWAQRAGWTPPAPTDRELASIYAEDAYSAIVSLAMLRRSIVGGKARDIATAAVSALVSPDEAEIAVKVERMHQALLGGEEGSDRLVVYELEQFVNVARLWGQDGPAMLRAKLVERWPKRAPKITEADLAASLKHPRLRTSGIVARILVTMQWWGPATIREATKRVSEILRQRKQRVRAK